VHIVGTCAGCAVLAVLLVAALGKLKEMPWRTPARTADVVGSGIDGAAAAVVELAIVALAITAGIAVGALAAEAFLVASTAYLLWLDRHGTLAACACFGTSIAEPTTALRRNAALIALAAVGAVLAA
jgi:hypothetical protein